MVPALHAADPLDAGVGPRVTIDPVALSERLTVALDTTAGMVAMRRAVLAVLAHDGAPTRPDGPTGSLADRWAEGDPLAEDTDWRSPLGPFRDPDVHANTLGELCAARLVSGSFAGDLLLALLVPFARVAAGDLLAGADDDADADTTCLAALARIVTDSWRSRPLGPLAVPA